MLSEAAVKIRLPSEDGRTEADTSWTLSAYQETSRTSPLGSTFPRGFPAKLQDAAHSRRTKAAGCCSGGFPLLKWRGGRILRRKKRTGWRRRRMIGCSEVRTGDWSVVSQSRRSLRSCKTPCPSMCTIYFK